MAKGRRTRKAIKILTEDKARGPNSDRENFETTKAEDQMKTAKNRLM